MIVPMAKVLLTGPKERLIEALTVVQQLGVMHIDAARDGQQCFPVDQYLSKLAVPVEQKLVAEGLFLERLGREIKEIGQLLSGREGRRSYLTPEAALTSLPGLVKTHIRRCTAWSTASARQQERLRSLSRYGRLLAAAADLVPDPAGFAALEAIGVVIADAEAFTALVDHLKTAGDCFMEVKFLPTEHGERIGLVIAERGAAPRLREALEAHGVAELQCPEDALAGLPFAEKRTAVAKMMAEAEQQLRETEGKLAAFARQWGGIYANVGQWLQERLAVLDAGAAVCASDLCFFLVGWIPRGTVKRLEEMMNAQFGGTVLVEEMEVFADDMDHIPIALQNPPYFRPFELFSRLLPLPRYSSFDITPYLAVFFPIFFGLMLGDVGYGVVLLSMALVLYLRSTRQREANDAAKILVVSSGYAIIFGALYGEFFGEIGHLHLGLPPGVINRQTAIMPMLLFSFSLGVVHVMLGLALGMLSALQRKLKREAVFKLFSIVLIVFLLVCGVLIWRAEGAMLPARPFGLVLAIICGVLLFSGGILAPLEVLKHFGSIISYARIMAIGLTSVLLAEVANQLAGKMGSLWAGLMVAVLLHAFNIVLGLFAPTIHALRLHYVEFFSKFMEESGRAFKPLRQGS